MDNKYIKNLKTQICFFVGIILLISIGKHKFNNSNSIQRVFEEKSIIEYENLKNIIKGRKIKRSLKKGSSVIENIIEIGPNVDSLICTSNGICYSGMVKELVIDSEDENTFVIATETSGAWISYNEGQNWNPIDDDWSAIRLNGVTQSKINSNIFYFFGLGPGLFIWDKSNQEGLIEWSGTINETKDSSFLSVTQLLIDPTQDSCHYIASSGSFYKYEDNGYTQINDLNNKVSFLGDFDIIPNGNIICSNVWSFTTYTTDGILYDYNTGITGNIGSELTFSPSDADIVYGFATSGGTFKMHRSRNGGVDWEEILSTNDIRFQYHDQTLEIYKFDDDRDLIIWGAVDAFVSIIDNKHSEIPEFKRFDGGHPDYHNSLMKKDTIYVSTDGGIFKFPVSDFENFYNNSISIIRPNIISLVNGLNTLQAVHVAYQENSDQLSMGFWHNGSYLKSSEKKYLRLNGGDGFHSAFHPNKNIVYSSLQNNTIYRFDIEENKSSYLSGNINDGPFETQLFTHKSNPEALFFMDRGIAKIENGSSCEGSDCNPIYETGLFPFRGISFDESERTNSIYAYSSFRIYKINNLSNIEPNNININLSDENHYWQISDIDISENEDLNTLNILLYDIDNDNSFSIWKIKDIYGNYNPPEIIIKQNLIVPDGLILNSILISPVDNNIALVGTNIGLYSVDLTEGILSPEVDIPAVEITELSYSNQLNRIHIATYGRGVWTAEFKQNISNVTYTDIVEININVYPNPMSDKMNIESSHTDYFKLISVQGIEVMHFKINANQTFSKDIKDLPDGIYWLIGSESAISKKVIKYSL